MKYDQHYHEEVALRDGRTVTLRLVRPEDKQLLICGFEGLSDQSRYQRFLAVKNRLSEAELRYLTDVDGDTHFALGAVVDEGTGVERGVGVARFVRFPGEENVAEPAITVVDEAQNLGLGGLLLQRLTEAAAERGVARFRAELLSGNKPIRHLLQKWFPNIRFELTGYGAAIAEVDLTSDIATNITESLPYRMLRRAAVNDMAVARAPSLTSEVKGWPVPVAQSEGPAPAEKPVPRTVTQTKSDEPACFRRVVLALDVFEPSENLLQVPAQMRAAKRELFILYCLDRPVLPKALPFPAYERLEHHTNKDLDKKLGDLAQPLLKRGFDVSARIVVGTPASGIVHASAELKADLVVVGTHDRKGVKRFLLGSVSEHVVRHCHCSVWVARPTERVGRLRRILVPTDFSAPADQALQMAASLVRKGGRITLFHCWKLPEAAKGLWAETSKGPNDLVKSLRQMFVEHAEAQGKRRLETHAGGEFEIDFEHINARARDGILQRLEQDDWDLVVMGSRGRRGLARWFLGSVADKVARRASQSVLIIRG